MLLYLTFFLSTSQFLNWGKHLKMRHGKNDKLARNISRAMAPMDSPIRDFWLLS